MIIGTQTDKQNPSYDIATFCVWFPNYKSFFETEEGLAYWNVLYDTVNQMCFKSIFGPLWSRAMALLIAHFLILIGNQLEAPSGSSLSEISTAGGPQGLINSASVGGFSVSYDTGKTVIEKDDAKWFNLTPPGAEYYAMLVTRHLPTIAVITSGPIPDQQQVHGIFGRGDRE